jgi:parallel beta-helix repeat protein
VVTKGSKPPTLFADLQQAVNWAANGSMITVTGRCIGPVFVTKRSNLIIQGVAPAKTRSGCPAGGLEPQHLTSTVTAIDDHVIKATGSSNIIVRFLNLVGGPSAGLELKDTSKSTAFCNCIARNNEGVELHGAQSSTVQENLIKENLTAGIRLNNGLKAPKTNKILRNVVRLNGSDGVLISEGSTQNEFTNNQVYGNFDNGMELNKSLKNRLTGNLVFSNATKGILILKSDGNLIKDSVISANGDLLVNMSFCGSGMKNTGNNVPPACQ